MVMSMRSPVWITLTIVGGLMLAFLLFPERTLLPPLSSSATQANPAMTAAGPSETIAGHVRTVVSAGVAIHALTTGGDPVPEAKVVAVAVTSSKGWIPISDVEHFTCDAAGVARLGDGAIGKSFIVTKVGYCGTRVETPRPGTYTAILDTAEMLVVKCVANGNAVPECLVVISRREVMPVAAVEQEDGECVGDPNAEHPVWRSRTNGEGICAFDVPRGMPLRVSVFHDAMYPVERWALGDEDIVPSARLLSVSMEDMYGIVARLPNELSAQAHFWRHDNRARSNEVGAIARMRYCTDRLSKRFPGCWALAARPQAAGIDFMAELSVLASDGSVWSLTWAAQPIAQILEPVFLEMQAAPPVADITVRLRVGGKIVDGIPMRLVRNKTDLQALIIPVVSGATVRAPSGTYWAETATPLAWIDDHQEQNTQDALPGGTAVIVCDVPHKLVHCCLSPFIANDVLARTAIITIHGSDASLTSVWQSGTGPLDLWLPPGDYEVTGYSDGFAKVESSIHVADDVTEMSVKAPVLTR